MDEKIKKAVDSDYEQICIGCFAHWISSMFISYEGFTFEENKVAFFYLLERLLREGKVKLSDPYDDQKDWGASVDEQVSYLKDGWPASAVDENDSVITDYFYDLGRCPPISWLGEDGKWYSS